MKSDIQTQALKQFLAILLNLFLGLFLVDATISFATGSLLYFFDIQILTPLSNTVSAFLILAAFGTYALMALSPAVPKRIFLPLTLAIPGILFGGLFLYVYSLDTKWVLWIASLVQLLLIVLALLVIRCFSKNRSWFLTADWIRNQFFTWKNFLGSIALTVLLGAGTLLFIGYFAVVAIDRFSHGFISLKSDCIALRQKHYVRSDGKEIHLIAMMHIAEPDFYKYVKKSFPKENAVILQEGVTDKENRLKQKLSYGKTAEALGVEAQHSDLTQQDSKAAPHLATHSADMDISEFSPKTIDFLNLITKILSDHSNSPSWQTLSQIQIDHQLLEQLKEDLLRRRNQKLLAHVDSELKNHSIIVIPWGAAHMPEIETEVLKRGFQLAKTQEFPALYLSRFFSKTSAK